MSHSEWRRGDFLISTDPGRLDLAVVHAFLVDSYWARGITLPELETCIRRSHPFGLYTTGAQVGFARVVTDYARFAYLADVFILEAHRGRGLGVWLVETVMHCEDFVGVWRWMLGTADAHGLYARFGFSPPNRPERLMEWVRREPK